MPTKAERYAQMADKVATQLTGSWQEWAGFLATASRLYKYPFHEQLMIYAQRPDATACAEYDLWNEKMGRYVRRGSKGIALVDDSGDRPSLRYVFDISDTGTREHSRTPWLWQLEERHLDSVQTMLERTYDVYGDDLAGQLTEVAGKLALLFRKAAILPNRNRRSMTKSRLKRNWQKILPITCSVRWKSSTRTESWNARRICSPNGPSNPIRRWLWWIQQAKHWRCLSRKKPAWI